MLPRWIFLLAFLSTITPVWSVDSTFSTHIKKPSLWGETVGPSGNAVPGVNILILPMFDNDGEHITLSSNHSGKILLTMPPKRPHDDYVIWKHPLFASWGRGHINIDKYGSDEPFNIELKKAHPFTGRVLNHKGKAIAGANIRIDADLPCGDHTHIYSDLETTVSDNFGNFEFVKLPPKETYRVLATHPMYVMTERVSHRSEASSSDNSSSNLIISMLPARTLLIDLVTLKGKSIPNKKVTFGFSKKKIEKFRDLNNKTSVFDAHSDSNGRIILQGPSEGFLSLNFNFKSHEEKSVLNLPLKTWNDQKISLKPKAEMVFQVVDQMSRKPIPNTDIRINFKHPTKNYNTSEHGKTDLKGNLTLFIPNIKKATAQAWAEGFLPNQADLAPQKNNNVLIELEKGTASVFSFHQPLPFGSTALIPNRSLSIEHRFSLNTKSHHSSRRSRREETKKIQMTSNDKGQVSFGGFTKGDQLKFRLKGYVPKTLKAPTPGDEVKVILEPGTILSFSVLNDTGEEVKRPRFYLKSGGRENSISAKYDKKSRRHRLEPLTTGTHTIVVKEWKHQDLKIEVKSGPNEQQEYDVELLTKPEITIRLIDLKEKKPSDVQVQFKTSKGRSQGSRVTEIKGSSPPSYRCQPYQDIQGINEMMVMVQDFLPLTIPVDFEKQKTYDLSLKPGLELSAIITTKEGTPVESADISITELEPWRLHQRKSDKKGVVKVGGLKEGIFRAKIKKKGFAPLSIDTLEFKKDLPPFNWTLDRGLELEVLVTDQNSLPLPDVEVKLLRQSEWGGMRPHGSTRPKTSDETGTTIFSNLLEGNYKVTGTSELLGLGESETFSIEKGERKTVSIIIKEGLKISGIVSDELDRPIPGVVVRENMMMNHSSRRGVEAETDEDGRFVLSNLPKGVFSIYTQHDEYEQLTTNLQVQSGKSDLIVKMESIKNWKIKVLKPDGQVTTEARLHRYIPQWGGLSELHNTEIVDDHYKVTSRQLGGRRAQKTSFRIVAKHDGFGPGESDILSLENMTDLTIRLTANNKLRVMINDSDGQPVPKAQVWISRIIKGKEVHSGGSGENFTDDQGLITLEGLSQGPHKLKVEHGDYAMTTQDIDLRDSMENAEVTLSKGGKVRGYVIDHEHNPKQGVRVWISKEGNPGWSPQETISGPDGSFDINHLPEGNYLLSLSYQKRSWMRQPQIKHPFTISDGEELELNLQLQAPIPMGDLKCSVESSTSYRSASLIGQGIHEGEQHQAVLRGKTFSFKNIPVGKYSLTLVSMNGFVTKNVTILEGETTEINIAEQEKFRVTAQIVDEQERPILAGMLMVLRTTRPENTNIHSNPEGIVGMGRIEAGKVDFEINEHGTFDLMISVTGSREGGGAFLIKEVRVHDDEETDLGILKRPISIKQSLTVLDSSGLPLEGAAVSIIQDGVPMGGFRWVTNGEGITEISRGSNSPFKLIVQHRDHSILSKEVSHTNAFEVRLSKGHDITLSLPEFPNTKVELVDENMKSVQLSTELYRKPSMLLDSRGDVKLKKVNEGLFRLKIYKSSTSSVYTETFQVGSGHPNHIRLIIAP